MATCVLSACTRSRNECSKVFHCLNNEQVTLVQQRAGIAQLEHSRICMLHYNKYLFHWRGEGCIDPTCSVSIDQKLGNKSLVQCPSRIILSLNNIYKVCYPEGSFIHYRCR